MLNINPKMLPRLDEIEDDLLARRTRAEQESWLGEVEGIDLTLQFLRTKREATRRLARVAPVDLSMPQLASATRAPAAVGSSDSVPATPSTRDGHPS
jgi:hypothetical protein